MIQIQFKQEGLDPICHFQFNIRVHLSFFSLLLLNNTFEASVALCGVHNVFHGAMATTQMIHATHTTHKEIYCLHPHI